MQGDGLAAQEVDGTILAPDSSCLFRINIPYEGRVVILGIASACYGGHIHMPRLDFACVLGGSCVFISPA